jgi:hypothetical protein
MTAVVVTILAVCGFAAVSAMFTVVYCRTAMPRRVQLLLETKYKAEHAILPEGFHPAEQIRGAVTQWLTLPFGNALITCKLRVLGAGEYPDVSLVERATEYKKEMSFENQARLLNVQEEYCRKALVCPAFEEFEQIVLGEDGKARAMREEYAKMKALADAEPDNRTRDKMLEELRPLQLSVGYFLPPNFMSAVAAWCECLDVTNIKQITPEKLIAAYKMSMHYHNRASDNLQGVYLEHTRNELDILAANTYYESLKKPKR